MKPASTTAVSIVQIKLVRKVEWRSISVVCWKEYQEHVSGG
jgi:hypothetical protein